MRFLTTLIIPLAVACAPVANADDWAPHLEFSGPSPIASINYLLSESPYYPLSDGGWQGYATPPSSDIIQPGPEYLCDSKCPVGWDLWYR